MGIISGLGSFRGQFGDHFRVGDHFGVGIISGAVQVSRCTLRSLACKRLPWTFSCKWFIYYLLFLESTFKFLSSWHFFHFFLIKKSITNDMYMKTNVDETLLLDQCIASHAFITRQRFKYRNSSECLSPN